MNPSVRSLGEDTGVRGDFDERTLANRSRTASTPRAS